LPIRGKHVERSQEAAVAAVSAVLSHLDSEEDLPAFFGRLSATVASLSGARRAAFWRLGARGTLTLQPAPCGFASDSPVYRVRLQLGADGDGVVERVIFRDELDLFTGTSPGLDATWRRSGLEGVKNSIAAAWTAGERQIGAVAVYDSPHGFTAHDLWVLRLVGMTAGLVWQCRESEDELGRMAARLDATMTARRRLLNNMAAGALIDGPLQLLTAAELRLERMRRGATGGDQAVALDSLLQTLLKLEDALQRLLADVRLMRRGYT
jgi:hypothetical protein